jgi:hypothetical protein
LSLISEKLRSLIQNFACLQNTGEETILRVSENRVLGRVLEPEIGVTRGWRNYVTRSLIIYILPKILLR